MIKKIAKGLKVYLTDWKNLLTHSLVGIILVVIALFAPVDIHFKILFLLCVVGFNLIRMKYFK